MSTVLQQLNTDLASLVDRVGHALVEVRTDTGGSGAGTVWHADGLVVTSAHVVQGRPARITLADGRTLTTRTLALDPARDLAALVVDAADLPTVPLGDSRGLQPGEWVVALGHPWGIRGAVTAGVVIGLGATPPGTPLPGREWVIVATHLRPGYSGGPLLDAQGRLIGINTMVTGPGVGMAVPVHVATAFLRESLSSLQVPA